jgi:hypothetical protein
VNKKILFAASAVIALVVVATYFLSGSAKQPAAAESEGAIPSPAAITSPAPAVTPSAAPVESGAPAPTRAELQRMMSEVEKSLSAKAQLKKLTTEQVHHTPEMIRAAGLQLGRIADALSRDPSLAPDAVPFYEKCAKNEGYPNTVRALCWSDYERIANGLRLPVNAEGVPANVRELADQVKGL